MQKVVFVVLIFVVAFFMMHNNAVFKEMSIGEQLTLQGGCDIDCESVGSCSTIPTCQSGNDCAGGAMKCTDGTSKETCTKITKWGLDCVVDPSHSCSPKKQLSGTCNVLEGKCNTTGGDQGACGTSVSQCHY